MPMGPGKYDPVCTHVRESMKARAACVIIIGGEFGDGFSVQADAITMLRLAALLEDTAAQIRRSGPFGPRLQG
jgi:hypothetical protein